MGLLPQNSSKGHKATGDHHGQPHRVAQQPDHGNEGHYVEDGAIVGQEGHQLM